MSIKKISVSENDIEKVAEREEKDGWMFISATKQSDGKTYFEPTPRSFPATYLLFFRKEGSK